MRTQEAKIDYEYTKTGNSAECFGSGEKVKTSEIDFVPLGSFNEKLF